MKSMSNNLFLCSSLQLCLRFNWSCYVSILWCGGADKIFRVRYKRIVGLSRFNSGITKFGRITLDQKEKWLIWGIWYED